VIDDDDLDAELRAHDAQLARRSVDVWVGAEPTFTRADSTEPAWLFLAEGDDKLERAHRTALALAEMLPNARVDRVLGRRYPDEAEPRFAWGVRWGVRRADAPTTAEPIAPPTADDLAGDRWLTVTPDPGVVEVNMAPCAELADFGLQSAAIWRAAAAAGLSPRRFRWNGDVTDSGGGGQLTLGGARFDGSPFVRYARVLPGLVRYLNDHPSLGFWFAGECVGSASQAPRPDQGVRERWSELATALDWLDVLADRGELDAATSWHALAPLLVDAAGNSHRAELNIEKLANPHLAPHGTRTGTMGVVELRALRMPERPTMLAAAAAVFRAIAARLAVDDYRAPLIDWHDELHDRFALPAALELDLQRVLGDLDEHGFGLPAGVRAELAAWRSPPIACRLGDAVLELRRAVEFWPLLGDVASQERSGARWVDASTERWELRAVGAVPDSIVVAGRRARLHPVEPGGPSVVGVRRRVFAPVPGLHPGLPPLDPLVIEWSAGGRAQRIELWSWRPDGGAYPAIPTDATEAATRRAERVVITPLTAAPAGDGWWPRRSPFTIDVRLRT
jgi:uncharacterized protein (DUF2126 family)